MVVEAGLLSFFRTLLIFVAIFYGFRLIVRFLFPLVLKWFVNKQQSKFRNQTDDKSKNQKSTSSKSKSHTEGIGDYVDYEELKD
ncbi:MAG: DUF4834 domain-containing protein [Vicingaceae bacterium]